MTRGKSGLYFRLIKTNYDVNVQANAKWQLLSDLLLSHCVHLLIFTRTWPLAWHSLTTKITNQFSFSHFRNFIGDQVEYISSNLDTIQYQLANHPLMLDNSLFYDVFGNEGGHPCQVSQVYKNGSFKVNEFHYPSFCPGY